MNIECTLDQCSAAYYFSVYLKEMFIFDYSNYIWILCGSRASNNELIKPEKSYTTAEWLYSRIYMKPHPSTIQCKQQGTIHINEFIQPEALQKSGFNIDC